MVKSDGLAAAQPPVLLVGAMSVLLTNATDYTARFTLSKTNDGASSISGNLFQQEGQLLFVRTSAESLTRNSWAGSFRFLWNVGNNSGLVISHALHGYAPVHSPTRFKCELPQADAIKAAPEQIDGQACLVEEVKVSASPGGVSNFRVWRASELAGLPLRIVSTDPTNGFVLQLSELNPDPLSLELFAPPEGFARYESVQAMVDALAEKPRVMPYNHENSDGRSRRK